MMSVVVKFTEHVINYYNEKKPSEAVLNTEDEDVIDDMRKRYKKEPYETPL